MSILRRSNWIPALLALLLQFPATIVAQSLSLGPVLADPVAANSFGELPRPSPHKLDATPPFNVNGQSREQVRQFYNAVYMASSGVAMDATADVADCIAGTNSAAFQQAALWRINWFRAMSGVPANVTLSDSECEEDQEAALMMSANDQLLHSDIPLSWSCFNSSGTNAAQNSNLALGVTGPDAITGYIWDYGANPQVSHRRWLLYPQTQVMATGDVPPQGSFPAANATWIEDANFGGPRPATVQPYVAWPPPGYVPYPVVFPQWSFALSNADLSVASVSMSSNDVPLNVVIQPYVAGYGEDTLVWYPANLNPSSYQATFPFTGADTVYSITVNNVKTIAGAQSFSYNVIVFDPATPGADNVPVTVSGTNLPAVNQDNIYTCTPSANPNVSGYEWMDAQSTNGDMIDRATNGPANFTISPAPQYAVITNAPAGGGNCFHLTHVTPAPQLLELDETLFPNTGSTLGFQSLLAYSSTNETARVQLSTNDGETWIDLYAQRGSGGAGETKFTLHTISLSPFAGQISRLRFNYDYAAGPYYSQDSINAGWCLKNISLSQCSQLIDLTTNVTASDAFDFIPSASGNWLLRGRAMIFGQFGLDWSPLLSLTTLADITQQPAAVTIPAGGTAMFTVAAAGPGPFGFQWQFNGAPLSGATSDALLLRNVQASQQGIYSVMVTSPAGSISSSNAVLTLVSTNANPALNGTFKVVEEWSLTVRSTINGISKTYHGAQSGEITMIDGQFSLLDRTGLPGTSFPATAGQSPALSTNGGAITVTGGDVLTCVTNQSKQSVVVVPLTFFIIDVEANTGATPPWTIPSTQSPIAAGETLANLTNSSQFIYSSGSNTVTATLSSRSSLTPLDAPLRVSTQPRSQIAALGSAVFLTVANSGAPPFSCQWKRNGIILTDDGVYSGTSTAALVIPNMQSSNAGAYSATISSAGQTVSSADAIVKIGASLSVRSTGPGTVRPNSPARVVPLGQPVALQAAPSAGGVFNGWSGSLSAASSTLRFVMQSNMILDAAFVENPFPSLAGNYRGLFAPTNTPRAQTNSGALTLTVNKNGLVSGKLEIGSAAAAFGGKFGIDGAALLTTRPPRSAVLTVALQLNSDGQTVTGAVSDGSFMAPLLCYKAVSSAATSATDYSGRYTFAILGTNDASAGPAGVSCGTAFVTDAGRITAGWNFADGASATAQSGIVSQNGAWPLYLNLYAGHGSLWGWINFSNGAVVPSALSWINGADAAAHALYRSGFTNQQATVIGSSYSSETKPSPGFINGIVTLSGGDLPGLLSNAVSIEPNDTIVPAAESGNTNKLALSFNPQTGVISGSFVDSALVPGRIAIHGVILQNITNAQGFFLGTNQSGAFLLTP